ncbi:MAG: hypothetical protein HY533_06310 [Chloroflexi bacterium]|nr:hypothetical protein [Chloroflexota bacterium]
MADKLIAYLVTYCWDCKTRIDIATEYERQGANWFPPKEGSKIEADVIKTVRQESLNAVPCYILELDTSAIPHCQVAKERSQTIR